MKSQSLHNSTKNGFMIVYSDVTAFHEVPLTTASPPRHPWFPSRNLMKNAGTYLPTMRDVIPE